MRLPIHEMGMINLLKSPQQKQYIKDVDSAEKLQSQGSKVNSKSKNGRQLSQAGGAIVSGGATLKVNSHRNQTNLTVDTKLGASNRHHVHGPN